MTLSHLNRSWRVGLSVFALAAMCLWGAWTASGAEPARKQSTVRKQAAVNAKAAHAGFLAGTRRVLREPGSDPAPIGPGGAMCTKIGQGIYHCRDRSGRTWTCWEGTFFHCVPGLPISKDKASLGVFGRTRSPSAGQVFRRAQ